MAKTRGPLAGPGRRTHFNTGGMPGCPPHQAAWDAAEPGAAHLITRYRDTNADLRTQLGRILRRAGVKQWPRRFQNLRASRETEWCERFPIHVVAEWLGSSPRTALPHDTQSTEEHYRQAAQGDGAKPGAARGGGQRHGAAGGRARAGGRRGADRAPDAGLGGGNGTRAADVLRLPSVRRSRVMLGGAPALVVRLARGRGCRRRATPAADRDAPGKYRS